MRLQVPWLTTIGPVLTIADVSALLLAGLVAREAAGPALVATVAAVAVARASDLHRPRLVLSIVEDLPGLLVAAVAGTVALMMAGRASAAFALLALACLVLAHTIVYATTHLLRRSGRLRRRVLVVGTGPTARRVAWSLLTRQDFGLRPVGFVATGAEPGLEQARGLPLALVGPVVSLPRLMADAQVDAVVMALPGPPGDEETAALEGLLACRAEVYAVPAWLPAVRAHARHPRELVGGVPVVHLHRRGTWLPVRAFKRVVEVLVAAVSVAALLPPAGVLAVLVLVETRGVLVREPRSDELGRTVRAPRFRTRRSRSVVRPGTTFSVAISGRLGPVGRLLRRSRLEALPALIWALLRRIRYPGGVPGGDAIVSATTTGADQAQVDAGQLAR